MGADRYIVSIGGPVAHAKPEPLKDEREIFLSSLNIV